MGNEPRDIDDLLERAYESEDVEEVEELVREALELDPENPEVLLLQADLTEDDEARLPVLLRAVKNARDVLEAEGIPEEEFAEDELGSVYLALLQRAAFTLFSMEDDERSFEIVQELMRHDLDDQGAVRSLYYRILIERRDWPLILRETMQDPDRQLGWAYARDRMLHAVRGRRGRTQRGGRGVLGCSGHGAERPLLHAGLFPRPGRRLGGGGGGLSFQPALLGRLALFSRSAQLVLERGHPFRPALRTLWGGERGHAGDPALPGRRG